MKQLFFLSFFLTGIFVQAQDYTVKVLVTGSKDPVAIFDKKGKLQYPDADENTIIKQFVVSARQSADLVEMEASVEKEGEATLDREMLELIKNSDGKKFYINQIIAINKITGATIKLEPIWCKLE